VTFKGLKKKVVLEATTQQQTKHFERLLNKPFWIWDQQQHKLEDIRTNEIAALIISSDCHRKMVQINLLYQYKKIIFDSLVTQNGNINSSNKKHLWIKKATGLGISEFMLRFMAWLCMKNNALSGYNG
jgi:hypothetical protein